MLTQSDKLRSFLNNRWLVFVASMWVQAFAGVGYLFGSISPLIKATMGYNQKQVSYLSVAKNLGDCIGFVAGALCEFLPFWGVLLIGVVQSFVGYGILWLIVFKNLTSTPLWVLCIAIFVGTNGETYYNTAALVSCVLNFPDSRGPIVGILKGFAGLSGAILSQIYHIFSPTNRHSLILTIAIVPSIVVLSLMFAIRYVEGHQQKRPSHNLSFSFVYGVCLLLAAYLMCLLLLGDHLSQSMNMLCSVILLVILLLPLLVPIALAISSEVVHDVSIEARLLLETNKSMILNSGTNIGKAEEISPQLGENFTLKQALFKMELWLLFASLVLGSGAGITIIDNMGQICESLGYSDTRIFISIISICNFLGRVGGGYFSELLVKNYAYPRLMALAVVQAIIAFGLLYYAMGWPAAIYTLTVLTSLGYGAHWGIAPASVSEMFGLRCFGALYNFVILAMPTGSFIFSSILASRIYDYYAEQQAGMMMMIRQFITVDSNELKAQLRDEAALTCTGSICYSVTCAVLCGVLCIAVLLSLIVVRRSRSVYAHLYIKSQS